MGVNIEKPVGLTISHGSLTERAGIRCAACQDRVRVVDGATVFVFGCVSYSDPCSFVLSLLPRFTLPAFCFFAFLNISLHGHEYGVGYDSESSSQRIHRIQSDQLSISPCS